MDTIDGRMDAIDGKMATIDGRMDAIDGKMDAIDGKMATIDGRMDAIDGKMATIDGRIDAIDGKMATIEARILNRTEGKLDAMEARINDRIGEAIETSATKLLTAFYQWASPVEQRMRTHREALRALDLQIDEIAGRVKKLEADGETRH